MIRGEQFGPKTMPGDQVPLVSILIRSTGRLVLSDALASVAAQTHPAVEVIVVDATGAHPDVPDHCGPFPINLVRGRQPRPRPVAANSGLDAAKGAYIGFLDDDDLIEPTHVAGLVAALEKERSYALAYSYAREVDATGRAIRWRATPYSRLLLFQDCYLVANAVLFRHELCGRCRFDERFDVCEDWDFWLQASSVSEFLAVPRFTAVYRSSLGQSGMGQGENYDVTKFKHYRAMLAEKWREAGEQLAAEVMPALDRELERAKMLWAQGDTGAAVATVEGILRHYPEHLGALSLYGTLDALRGDFQAAARRFRAAVAIAPEEPTTHFNLAQALERLGQARAAGEHYRRVLELAPSHSHARARLVALSPVIKRADA